MSNIIQFFFQRVVVLSASDMLSDELIDEDLVKLFSNYLLLIFFFGLESD